MQEMTLLSMLVVALAVIAVILLGMCLKVLQSLLEVMQKNLKAAEARQAYAPAGPPAAMPAFAAAPPPVPEKGLLLENIDDQTAAMVMAAVAEEMGAPLERLRFVSIKGI